MKTETQFRSYVMRRVYLTYCYRQVSKPFPRLVLFGVLVLALVGSVSIVNIVSNVMNLQGAGAFVSYSMYAFAGTQLVVQVITSALIALGGWFLYDTARNFRIVPEREAQF